MNSLGPWLGLGSSPKPDTTKRDVGMFAAGAATVLVVQQFANTSYGKKAGEAVCTGVAKVGTVIADTTTATCKKVGGCFSRADNKAPPVPETKRTWGGTLITILTFGFW